MYLIHGYNNLKTAFSGKCQLWWKTQVSIPSSYPDLGQVTLQLQFGEGVLVGCLYAVETSN